MTRAFSLLTVAVTVIVVATSLGAGTALAHPIDDILNDAARYQNLVTTFFTYLVLGYTHILPKGLDHILFVLGLFLLSPSLRPLLWQVTAFTLAHTITLALSIIGTVSAPSGIVEPIIALSITFVALENVLTKELKPWRPLVVFMFGLVHGLGFAGVLEDLGLPEGQTWTALAAFNIGVEFGQISVILIALGVVWFVRNRDWYRPRVAIPASILIGAVGLFWFFERAVAAV